MYLVSSRTLFSGTSKDPIHRQLHTYGQYQRLGDRALRTWNTVFSFVCFGHYAERCLCPYRQLPCGFELYADLPIVLTVVHCDGTSILSLHNTRDQNHATDWGKTETSLQWIITANDWIPSDFWEMTQIPSDFLHNDSNALAYPLHSRGNILMNTWSKASTRAYFEALNELFLLFEVLRPDPEQSSI